LEKSILAVLPAVRIKTFTGQDEPDEDSGFFLFLSFV